MSALDDARTSALALFVQRASIGDMEKAYWELVAQGGAGTKPTTISTKTADYTMVASDSTILVNATGAMVTITLPTAASVFKNGIGQRFSIKKVDSSTNAVTVKASGSELIDGMNTSANANQYDCVTVQSNGTAYYVISRNQ